MVVWLKPCKSRSSPGALSPNPRRASGGGLFFVVAPSARPATGHRQGLYQNASPAMGRRSPVRGLRLRRELQQVIAWGFIPKPSSRQRRGFVLCGCAIGANCNRSSPGALSPNPRRASGGGLFFVVAPSARTATGHRQGLYPQTLVAQAAGFVLCGCAIGAIRNRSSPGALSERLWEAFAHVAFASKTRTATVTSVS